MRISVIIVTYNNTDALRIVLDSILQQKKMPHEIIIADDGSSNETALLIETFNPTFPVTLKHVWHEDIGFRVAKIRNEAIKTATGDYLIFSDGDLFFHPYFIHDYLVKAKKGHAQIGSRVFLKKEFATTIESEKPKISFISPHIERNRINAIRLPAINKLFRDLAFSKRLRGGLLGVWKEDLLQINGWNEDFFGWGKEDTELVARLSFSGVTIRKIKFAGITYHLWHSVLSRTKVIENDNILNKTIYKKESWCKNGIRK